jgi:hypothetical protein
LRGAATWKDTWRFPLAVALLIAMVGAATAQFLFTRAVQPYGLFVHRLVGLDYNYFILRSNYVTNGFVRRGLLGAIATLLGAMREPGGLIALQAAMAAWLAVPLIILLRRLSLIDFRMAIYFGLVALASPQMFLAWGGDVGRPDMFTCGILGWALIATLANRYVLAAGALLIGSLAHETAIIYGVPLCATFGFLDWRGDRGLARRGVAALVGLGAGLVLISLAQRAFSPGDAVIARTIVDGHPEDDLRVWAAYMAVGGVRTLLGSACVSFARPATGLYLFGCLMVWAAYSLVLLVRSRLALLSLTVASLAPLAAMCLLAIDYGRWLEISVTSAWLAAVSLRVRAFEVAAPTRTDYGWGAGALVALLAMGPTKVPDPNWASERLARLLWPHANQTLGSMDRCDPDWRSVGLGRR